MQLDTESLVREIHRESGVRVWGITCTIAAVPIHKERLRLKRLERNTSSTNTLSLSPSQVRDCKHTRCAVTERNMRSTYDRECNSAAACNPSHT